MHFNFRRIHIHTEQFQDYEAELKKLEDLLEDELRELQLKQIQKHVNYCYEKSPYFFRERLDVVRVKKDMAIK